MQIKKWRDKDAMKCLLAFLVIISILYVQSVSGIEIDYSLNDIDVSSQYDVDDSVYVYEDVSGDPQLTTVRDYREVSGGGKKNLEQRFSSNTYSATSGIKADSGWVQSSAYLTSTTMSATQSANIAGTLAQSFLVGSQNYMGGTAFTGQYIGVENGILSTVQTLSLGSSIYSTQYFQASGINPLAIGYAFVGLNDFNSFDDQGAFIVTGASNEGSISGFMGAEVVKVPDAIDPVAYGSHITAQGDEAAGIIAGAGALQGFLTQNQFANFISLYGQGAITGAVGIGENSRASVDYIRAQTDGRESSAFEVDAKAKGNDAAIVAAGAGNFELQSISGFQPFGRSVMAFYDGGLGLQGAIIGAAGIGDDSKAKANWVGAITDGSRTLAMGDRLKVESNGLALVGAAAGSVGYGAEGYYYRSRHNSLLEEYRGLGVEGALALAAGAGEDSKASADFMAAGTNGDSTDAFAADAKARGDYLATVLAGAGDLYAGSYEGEEYSRHHGYDYGGGEYIGVQGALAGALGIGSHSKASVDFIAAGTDGDETAALSVDAKARGNDLAAVLAGAGNLYASQYEYGSNSRHGDSYDAGTHLDAQGALVGALGVGDHSSASADFIGAETNGDSTNAIASDARAEGNDLAAVLAGAGSLDAGSYEYEQISHRHGYDYGIEEYIGVQGALAGALGIGGHSSASADLIAAGTNGDETAALAVDAKARGNDLAAVLAGAGNLYASQYEYGSISRHGDKYYADTYLDAQAALVGVLGIGDHSSASAELIAAGTNGDETTAFAADAKARGDDLAAVLAGAGSIDAGSYVYDRDGHHRHTYESGQYIDAQAAFVGALGIGDHSSASADFIAAGTNGQETYAFAVNPKARGDNLAAVLAGAGSLYAESQEYHKNSYSDFSRYLGAQGALVGALGVGECSRASADFIGAETDGYHSTAVATDLRSRGDSFAAVAAGAGAIQLIPTFDYQGSAVGAYSSGPNSNAYARYIQADTSWDESSALARHIGSGPNGEVFAGVAHQSIPGVDGITKPAGSYNLAEARVTSHPSLDLYWGIS